MSNLKEKLKDVNVQIYIAAGLTAVFIWVALTRAWEGLNWGL